MEHKHIFSGASPDAVFAEFTNPDFLHAFSAEVGVESDHLTTSVTDGIEKADMPWSFPTNRPGIPSLARKMLPPAVNLDWHQEWGPAQGSPISGSMHVVLHGKPSADVTAKAQLAAQGSDTVYTAVTTTKTSLRWPLAGSVEGTIDKELVGWILSVQARVLRRRLGLPE